MSFRFASKDVMGDNGCRFLLVLMAINDVENKQGRDCKVLYLFLTTELCLTCAALIGMQDLRARCIMTSFDPDTLELV